MLYKIIFLHFVWDLYKTWKWIYIYIWISHCNILFCICRLSKIWKSQKFEVILVPSISNKRNSICVIGVSLQCRKLGCGVEFAYLAFECSSLSKNLQYILGEQNFRAFPLLFILPRLSFCFSFLCFWSRILNINPSSISNPLSHPTWESLEQLISFLSIIQDRQWRIEYLN